MNAPGTSAPRILVVEDDQIFHSLVLKVLRREGYNLLSAYTGEEALSILRRDGDAINWLITDIRLPGVIDGWVVGSEFHLTQPLRPVVYMSAVEEDCLSKRSRSSVFLYKPFDNHELVQTFRTLIGTHDRAVAP